MGVSVKQYALLPLLYSLREIADVVCFDVLQITKPYLEMYFSHSKYGFVLYAIA